MKSYVVYFDEEYPTHWIPRELSESMTKRLERLGFSRKNAHELKDWMIDVINEGLADKTIIVFSQDVMPETVFDRFTPEVLIRQYLDAGGCVFWMGDIPFWYLGKYNKMEDVHNQTAFMNILSIIPVITFTPSNLVKITEDGRYYGLKSRWSSHRPVMYVYQRKMDDFIALANSKLFVAWPVPLTIENQPVVTFIRKLGKIEALKSLIKKIRGVSALGGFKLEFQEFNGVKRFFIHYEGLPCAWIKKFGKGRFIRIWDFPFRKELLRYYENKLLNDLINIIKKIKQ